MNSSWTKEENSTGVLTVTVEGEEWKKARDNAFKKLKSALDVKGFRKGQVPDAIAKAQIPSANVYYTAAEALFNKALQTGVEATGIELAAQPAVDIKEADEDKLVLDFQCTVIPEVKLGQYEGLKVKKEPVEVTEEEIDQQLKNIQDRYADWVLVEDDQPAEDGDQVTIDYAGQVEGTPFEGGTAENYPLVLGSNTFIPGFEEQLVGIKSGETRDITVTFPENYHEGLSGKEAVFTVTAHDIKRKELPELNDDLVSMMKLEGVETLEKYKEQAKEQLLAQKEQQAQDNFNNQIMNLIVDGSEVEIPEVMINNEVEQMFRQFAGQLQQAGFTPDQYFAATGVKPESIKAEMRGEAEKRVKASLVLEAIANAQNLEVSREDLDKEYQLMSEMYQMPVEQLKAVIAPASMEYDLKQQKALEFVKDHAKTE